MPPEKFNYSVFWNEAIARMQSTLSEQESSTWLNRISYVESQEGKIILAVPSLFIRDYVSAQYQQKLVELLAELVGEQIEIDLIVQKIETKANSKDEAARVQVSQPLPTAQKKPRDPNINAGYQFDSFVVGDNSIFAYNVSLAIAKNPGSSYNPCLIYGGVGLGKTHLIQSIGNYIHTHTPEYQVVYVTAEMFTNEFIQAIPDKRTSQFRNKYRKADVLLIDDIHFLQRKDSTQEELFHVFNILFEANKQLVFTCDRPISELQDIADRLRNRFTRGINVDLQPPDFETRMAILHRKSQEKDVSFSEEVLDYICRNVNSNVRDLESSLMKLIAYSQLLGKEITLEIAKEQLKGSFSTTKDQSLPIEAIIKIVAEYFNISSYDIKGKKRTKSVVLPRQIAMYIARDITDFSTTEIGYEFGGRDHTTVMHSIQRIDGLMKSDTALEHTVETITRRVQDYKRGK